MDERTAELTIAPATLALIASLPPYREADALALATRLRTAGADPATVTAALTQSRLRHQAAAKFGDFANGMVFTQAGLEQATRLVVAAHHARRYAAVGTRSVADLTCGIGADAMAMSALGIGVTAFEVDRATALLADYNLRHWEGSRVVNADALATLGAGELDVEAVFADPARRGASGRTHSPSDYTPPLDAVIALRSRWEAVGLKVGPGLPHDAVPPETEAEWVSVDGDVVEAGLWMGPLATHHGHGALVLRGSSAHRFTGPLEPGEPGELGSFVLEPDGAIIRAGLVGPLAAELGAHLLAPDIAYLSAPAAPDSPFVAAFRVLDVLPYDERQLAKALAAMGIGTAEIKKRGMDVDPAALRKRLRLKGDGSATVILTRLGTRRVAIIAERTAAS